MLVCDFNILAPPCLSVYLLWRSWLVPANDTFSISRYELPTLLGRNYTDNLFAPSSSLKYPLLFLSTYCMTHMLAIPKVYCFAPSHIFYSLSVLVHNCPSYFPRKFTVQGENPFNFNLLFTLTLLSPSSKDKVSFGCLRTDSPACISLPSPMGALGSDLVPTDMPHLILDPYWILSISVPGITLSPYLKL